MAPYHDKHEMNKIGYQIGYETGFKKGYEKARAKKAGVWFLIGWATMAAMFLIPKLFLK